jgi:hypothetical protein
MITSRLRSMVLFGFMLVVGLASVASPVYAANAMPIFYKEWNGAAFTKGTFSNAHTATNFGRLAVTPANPLQPGMWTSPVYKPAQPVNKVVLSWQAKTPGESWTENQLQVQLADGSWSDWFTTSKSAFATTNTNGIFTSNRGFAGEQASAYGSIDQDTYWANDDTWVTAYRVRAVMHADGMAKPVVTQLAAVASDYLQKAETGTSATTMTKTIDLPVPALSQYVHNDEYAQFDGGGAAWCSPTSVAMLLRYYKTGPTAQQIAALPADTVFDGHNRKDGDVDYAAYHTFDNGYPEKNTGNWPLNVAYAANYGLSASVRQYNSLRSLEDWIKKGVPVVVTLKFDNTDSDPTNDLTGASISKTAGHLMVVRGFTADGKVIANDPASPAGNQQVRHVYDRAQFEHIWLTAKGGTVYIIKP